MCDLFVQGEIDRRPLLDAAEEFTAWWCHTHRALENLRPNCAWAEQVPKTESCMTTEWETGAWCVPRMPPKPLGGRRSQDCASRTAVSDGKAAVNLTRQCALAFLQPLLHAVGLADSDLEKRRPFSLTVRFHFNVTGTDAT